MQAGDETDTREEFPRISVDSLRDWERIKNGYTGAAHSLLESRLGGKSETERRMLRGQLQRVCCLSPSVLLLLCRVRLHVVMLRAYLLTACTQFIDRTFEKAKNNLRVNGRNFEDLDPDEQSASLSPSSLCSRF